MFRPPSLLAPLIVPTAANTAAGQLGLLRPGLSCFVASARSGYANRPKTGNWRYGDLHPARLSALSAAPITLLHHYYEAVRPSPAHRYFWPRGCSACALYGLFVVKRTFRAAISFSCFLRRFLCSIWNPVSSPRPTVLQGRRAQELSRLAVAPTFPSALPLPGHTLTAPSTAAHHKRTDSAQNCRGVFSDRRSLRWAQNHATGTTPSRARRHKAIRSLRALYKSPKESHAIHRTPHRR